MENPGWCGLANQNVFRGGGGGVWIFSGTTHSMNSTLESSLDSLITALVLAGG